MVKKNPKDDMVSWNVGSQVMVNYSKQIDEKNAMIEKYTKLYTAVRPIIEKYAQYFSTVYVQWENASLTLKDDCAIPPLYCEADLAGLSAVYKEKQYDNYDYTNYHYRYNSRPRNTRTTIRNLEITLKP